MQHTARTTPLLFIIALLALMPAIGLVSHAQDGGSEPGRQVPVSYQLRMPTAEERICLNQNRKIPLRVEAVFENTGDVDAVPVQVRGINLGASSTNASVATAELSGPTANPTSDQPLRADLLLNGRTVGTTTVTVDATIHSSSGAPVQLQATLPVRVVVCEYRVEISSLWHTSLHQAPYVVNVNVRNIRITGTGGRTLENERNLGASPPLEWNITVNRIRGCEVGHPHQTQRAPQIRAEIQEESLVVDINYERLTPFEPYYVEACRVDHPFQHSAPCYEHPDGVCFVWKDGPRDWFHPADQQIFVPLDGGTVVVPHQLRHSWGTADGGTIITITPVRRQ